MATKLTNIDPSQPQVDPKTAQTIHDQNSAEMLQRLQQEVDRRAAKQKS